MANEATITASLSFLKGSVNEVFGIVAQHANVAGKHFVKETMSVPTTSGGAAIPLGPLTTLGLFIMKNNDATNYVEILNAVSGTPGLRIGPGMVALGQFAGTVTAPAAIAHTAACDIEYFIVEQ